jgi:hypothetical protein
MFNVILRVKNGGEQNVFSTQDRQYAASFCKSKNDFYRKVGSSNRYHFEETD